MNRILFLEKRDELKKAFPVIQDLRPHLSEQQFIDLFFEMNRTAGYTLAALVDGEHNILGLMGYRFLVDYVRGSHLYIDDLIVKSEFRSQKLGEKLLAFAEQVAKTKGVKTLRLSTGIENERAMKFYERSGWEHRSMVYIKSI